MQNVGLYEVSTSTYILDANLEIAYPILPFYDEFINISLNTLRWCM